MPIIYNPDFVVTKSTTTASVNAAGDVISYTITIANTGNVSLTGASVTELRELIDPMQFVPCLPSAPSGH